MSSPIDPTHDPIGIALSEDIGSGDVTAAYFLFENQTGVARIVAREKCVVAGVDTAAEVFRRVDPRLSVTPECIDGDPVAHSGRVLEIAGSVRSMLTAERVALNFLQRLSGIATSTRRFVDAVSGTRAVILDTRKTTPGLRALEKAAVRAGGGRNHRFGLYDMAMVKDNHLAATGGAGGLGGAIASLRSARPDVPIEIEAENLDEVKAFLGIEGIDRILLDNMSVSDLAEAVRLGAGRVKFEASGGVSLESVARIAQTGVDFISVGALTHSVKSIDFSMEME